MRYLSLFSGIESASVAWHPLGWEPVAFAEIDPFASAVLAHHYPGVPNLGDVTKVDWKEYGRTHRPDVVVFGSPCQSFSVAGKRLGLDDPRGNLALYALGIVDALRPEWFLFENVPGLLSSGDGRDFGAFLGTVADIGYSGAWTILDAQFVRTSGYERAVPQRRRRIFFAGHSGDWRRPAAVLLDASRMRWDPPPRREAGKGVAPTISARPTGGGGLGTDFDCDGGLIPSVCGTLRAEGFDASEDGTGRGTPLVPVAFNGRMNPIHGPVLSAIDTDPLTTCVAFGVDGACGTLRANPGSGTRSDGSFVEAAVIDGWAVRRLTPTECEALQGFPRGYTDVPYRNKPAADGPRYKALGNSMACNVMRWIGRRIQLVEDVSSELQAREAAE